MPLVMLAIMVINFSGFHIFWDVGCTEVGAGDFLLYYHGDQFFVVFFLGGVWAFVFVRKADFRQR